MTKRSACPISNVLDIVGDKWSLLVLRDLMFFKKQRYSELQHSDEKIATNILSQRLEHLESSGLISKKPDAKDKRKKVYSLTDKGIDMLPILIEMMIWSDKHEPLTNAPTSFIEQAKHNRAELIEKLVSGIKSQPSKQ